MRMSSGGKFWKQYISLTKKRNGRKERFWTFRGRELFFEFLDRGYKNIRVVSNGKLIMRSATYEGV